MLIRSKRHQYGSIASTAVLALLTRIYRCWLHRSAGFGFAQGRAGFGEAAQWRRGGLAGAILLVPGLDLAVDLGHANRVGPVHQPAAVAREAEAVEPHHVDVTGAVGPAFVEDLAGLLDRGEEQRRRISSSLNWRCGMPSSGAFSVILCASAGSGCGVRSPFS
jgi:hypothetical protein